MRIEVGGRTYTWLDNWAKLPDTASARTGWAHPGLAVSAADEVFTYHPGDPQVLVFDRDGALLRSIATGLTEGHGITLSREGDVDYLWIADSGAKRRPDADYGYHHGPSGGQVVKMTLDGQVVLTLETPLLDVYREGRYQPTSVAVNEERFGGNGDVWVADGYGQSYVHRYRRFSKRGEYLGSISGEEGGGRFATPHGLWIDTRKAEPELYVADRGNHRIQVYDVEGAFKRVVGAEFLSSPSAFARDGDFLVVAELRARLAILDGDDRLVGYLGDNEAVCAKPGWPNMLDDRGIPTRTNRLAPGKFNSPHGVGVDGDGHIYVAEWLIGGRMTKLVRV
jgi:hypothetical protein